MITIYMVTYIIIFMYNTYIYIHIDHILYIQYIVYSMYMIHIYI